MTYEEYIEQSISSIKIKLKDYLHSKRIFITGSGHFTCPNKSNHNNNDKTPSAHIVPGSRMNDKWYCFSCNESGDVFDAAHYIDGLPKNGGEFFEVSIPTLAKALSIEYTPEKYMDKDSKDIILMYKALAQVSTAATANLIKIVESTEDHPVKTYVNSRQLSIADLTTFAIGYMDLAGVLKVMAENNVPHGIQREICAAQDSRTASAIFSDHCLLFALRNPIGRVCGFAARNMSFETTGGSKYINSENCRIYVKNSYLYNLDKARHNLGDQASVYVMEGYFDVIRAVKAGIPNTVAVCGTAFTDHHTELLKKVGVSKLIFCLDSDAAGTKRTKAILDKQFAVGTKIRPFVMELESGYKDPDKFISEKGKDAFVGLPTYTIVEYQIRHMFSGSQSSLVSEKVEEFFTWLIQYELNPIKRRDSISTLSTQTGIKQSDLSQQLEYQEKLLSDDVLSSVEDIWYKLLREGKSLSVKERIALIDNARRDLTGYVTISDSDPTEHQIDQLKKLQQNLLTNTIVPVNFGWPIFTKEVNIPKDSSLAVVGAYPNVGKSIMMKNIAMNIIKHNPDMGVIYFTMDDPKSKTIPGFLAHLTNVIENDIRFPAVLPKTGTYTSEVLRRTKEGFDRLNMLMKTGRLAVFDQSDLLTIGELQTCIDSVGEKMQALGLRPFVIIDSIHSISDPLASTGLRNDTMHIIRKAKAITNIYHLPMMAVCELRKQQQQGDKSFRRRPTLRDISETVDIEYRVTVGMILHAELAVDNTTNKFWEWTAPVPGMGKKRLPIHELYVDKNKEAYFKECIYFKTNPFFSTMEETTLSELPAN